MSLDGYWKLYDHTLATIRAERPTLFAGVKVVLDRFQPPSTGHAFFPGGADDTLGDAISDAGWSVKWEEGDYLWTAAHPTSGAVIQYVEGDVYCLKEGGDEVSKALPSSPPSPQLDSCGSDQTSTGIHSGTFLC